jgi:hypothetical protein
MDVLDRLKDLHKQATTERSHYYVGSCVNDAIAEITSLRQYLANPAYVSSSRPLVNEGKIRTNVKVMKINSRPPAPPAPKNNLDTQILIDALRKLAKYPSNPKDELSAKSMRIIASDAIAAYDAKATPDNLKECDRSKCHFISAELGGSVCTVCGTTVPF